MPRTFANLNADCVSCGTIEQNGCGKLKDITSSVLRAIRALGTTHVWYTGVLEHAHCPDYSAYGIKCNNPHVIKGQAGSPYAITDYYDIDPDLAVDPTQRRAEFDELIKRTHNQRLKVIIDFVPNHVGREYHSDAAPVGIRDLGADDNPNYAFAPNNNFYYLPGTRYSPTNVHLGNYVEEPAKASGNDCFTPSPDRNDWYETIKLNYGVDYFNGRAQYFNPIPNTWHKMVHILCHWARKGVDGFRCDMAFMVPIEFWRWAIPQVRRVRKSVIFIAEIYETHLYREFIDAGFDYLYDKVNLYDTLRGVQCFGVDASRITNCWQAVDGIGGHMLNFLENHDEQRYASPFYAGDASTVLPSLVVASTISTGPMMIYAGQELGERGCEAEGYSGFDGRTSIFDYCNVPTVQRWLCSGKPSQQYLTREEISLRNLYARVLNMAASEPAIASGGFYDLMYVNFENPEFNTHRQYAYIRYYAGEIILIVVNFDTINVDVRINIPQHALDCIGIRAGEYDAREMISGRHQRKMLSATIKFGTAVPAHGAAIWKMPR